MAVMSNPSSCSGSWKNCTNAFNNDGRNSYITVLSTSNKSSIFENYGFAISNSSKIDNVKLRADFLTSNIDGGVKIKVSKDGGVSYGQFHIINGSTSKKSYWIDITDDFSWKAADLIDGKFKAVSTCFSKTKTTCYLDWLPVNVSFTKFDFSLSLNQTSLEIEQGKKGKANVKVKILNGFPVQVKLSKMCPEKLSCSLSPNSGIPDFNSILTITAKDSTPPGEYAVIVKGKGEGITKTKSLNVNILEKFELNELCKPIKYDNESLDNKINIVFVPSNFNGDMDFFKQKAQDVWNLMQQHEPFDPSINNLNIFYVPKESGDYCDLNCSGVQRLLCCKADTALSISSECTTEKQTIVIHNDSNYGGGGFIGVDMSTITAHPSSPKIAIHELGHSLFKLGDEYISSSSNPSDSPNCDYSSCSKWSSMIGYNEVDCSANSCANGEYYASETTIMRLLDYKFEEVNLRASCCAYHEKTGEFPEYCSQFNQFSPNNKLEQYCSSQFNLAPTTIYMNSPYEYFLVKDKEGNWKIENISPLKPRSYPIPRIKGNNNDIVIEANSLSNAEKFYFSDKIPVEYPKDEEKMGGYAEIPRDSISIIIDHSQDKPQTISVNGKLAFS